MTLIDVQLYALSLLPRFRTPALNYVTASLSLLVYSLDSPSVLPVSVFPIDRPTDAASSSSLQRQISAASSMSSWYYDPCSRIDSLGYRDTFPSRAADRKAAETSAPHENAPTRDSKRRADATRRTWKRANPTIRFSEQSAWAATGVPELRTGRRSSATTSTSVVDSVEDESRKMPSPVESPLAFQDRS